MTVGAESAVGRNQLVCVAGSQQQQLPKDEATRTAMAPRSKESLEQALEELLRDHSTWLKRTVERTCPRSLNIQSDEIEQDVRLRLWRVLERESVVRHPASYLHRVVATATIDAIRRAKARREEPLIMTSEAPDNPRAIDPVAHQPGPERQASAKETGALIQQSLASLHENRRAAVKLYLQGFTYQEVADLLEWTEAKARNLVSRGMQNLRDQLTAAGVRGAEVHGVGGNCD